MEHGIDCLPCSGANIITDLFRKPLKHLTCTMTSNQDLALYGVSRAKDWVSVNRGVDRKNRIVLWPLQVEEAHILNKPI